MSRSCRKELLAGGVALLGRWVRAIAFSLLAALAAFAGVAGGLSGTSLWTQLIWGVVAAAAAGVLVFLQTLAPAGGRLPLPITPSDKGPDSELPALPHGFVDRRVQIAKALRALRYRPNRAPLLVVTGLPGVGKTAFALVVASLLRQDEYPGRLVFIRLGSAEEAEKSSAEVLDSLLVALGSPRRQAEGDLARRQADVTAALNGKRALVIFDGVTSDAQVQDVHLPGGCAAIFTSTGELPTLRDRGAHHLWLGPFTGLLGLRLLAQRELLGTRRVAREPRTALRIVRYCGGLPQLLMVTAGHLKSRAGNRGSLRDAFRLQAESRDPSDSFHAVVEKGLDASYQGLTTNQQRAFQILGVLHGIELDALVVAAALATDTLSAERLMDELVNLSLVEPVGRGDRWRLHELVGVYARRKAELLPAAERNAVVSRTLPVYLRRAKTLGELLTPDVRRLYPELAALAQVAIDREWANATAEVDAAVRAGLDLLACLTGETIELLFELVEWPAMPGASTVMDQLLTAAKDRDAEIAARARSWLERHPEQRPGGPPPPPPPDPGRPPPPGPPGARPGGPGRPDQPPTDNRILRWLRHHWSRWMHPTPVRTWRITGSAVGYAPHTEVTLYVDGKRVATLDGHKLGHVEFIVRSRHQPHTIYITGTRVPGGPPARSSFAVQELAPP